MWDEAQRIELARITERDRQIAALSVRRSLPPRYAGMLDAEPGDDDSNWQYLPLVGLGVYAYRGRRVRQDVTRRQLDRAIAGVENDAKALSTNRRVEPDPWALGVVDVVKSATLIGGAFARGGWAMLDERELAYMERHILEELGYLDGFADGLIDGSVPPDGRFVRRAMLYGAAGWAFYQLLRQSIAGGRGFVEERNVLDPGAEHCFGCVEETARDWQPLGTLVPVGDRQCLSRCRCYIEYRKNTGETAT